MRRALLLTLLTLFVWLESAAQPAVQPAAQPTVDDTDNQSWNEVQLSVPLGKKVSFNTQVTARFAKNITRFNEGRFGFGFAYKPDKHWTFAANYQYIDARNTAGKFRREDRFDARVSYKFPIKRFSLLHRSTVEYRLRGAGNTWRYRPSLTFEKDLKFIAGSKLFIVEEPFYDSGTGRFSRNRFTVGLNKTLTKNLSLDVYYLRQNDGFSTPGDLNIIGTTWKIHL